MNKSAVPRIRSGLFALLAATEVFSAAHAELPSVKLMAAPPVAPSLAWTYYGSGTTHTTGPTGWTSANRPAEIKELARALGRGGAVTGADYAASVYEYIRNNIEVEYRFGLGKGARGALIDQSGTPFDQAHLMVELLREGGVSATYQVGTITLNGAQFYDWIGLTQAQASCRFLADGGIPATVNGANDCAALTGDVGTVTLGHIWVSAAGSLYDPSYKKHAFKAGVDLAAALGCGTAGAPTCGITVQGLIPTPATVSGVQRITNVPEASINAQLKTYAVNFQNWIKNYHAANSAFLTLEDVIGGKLIDQRVALAAAPISQSVQYSWAGDVPDQFRTTLRVQFDNIDQTLFVDELAGKRLRIWGLAVHESTANYTRTAALYAEYKPLAKSTRANATPMNGDLTLTANHPYAANSGSYMDDTLQRSTDFGAIYGESSSGLNVLTILNGWGDASQSTISHFGELQKRDLNSTSAEDISNANHYWVTNCWSVYAVTPSAIPAPDAGCYEQHQSISAATWLAEVSRTTSMTAQIANVRAQLHHSLGSIVSGVTRPVSILNAETSVSGVSTTALAVQRRAAYQSIAAAMSRLEGSVFEQQFDSWDGGSGVSYLVKSNAKGYASLWVDSSNVTTALSQLSNYSAARKSIIQSYTNEGFTVIVPQNGYLGSYSYSSGNTLIVNTNATAAYKATGDRVAYLVDGRYKGASAGSAIPPSDAALQSVKVMEYSLKGKKYFGVNLVTGELTLSPPPDIVSGAGDFPFSLPYRRFYNSSAAITAGDASSESGYREFNSTSAHSISDLGGGWSHNYDVWAKMESNPFKGLGKDSALDAGATIAALYTILNISGSVDTLSSKLSIIFTTNWWISRLQNNVVIVRRPPNTSTFTRMADGVGFSSEPGSYELLSQSGGRAFKVWLDNFGSGYNYSGASFSLIDATGNETKFSYSNTTFYNDDVAVPVSMIGANGVRVNFTTKDVNSCYVSRHQCLSSVSNSLGRTLSLDASVVADGNGRQVNIRSQHDIFSGYTWIVPDPGKNNSVTWVPTKLIVTGPDGGVTTYQYQGKPAVSIERFYPRIYQWYTPSSSTNSYLTADYDSFFRTRGITDNLAHRTDYYIAGLYGSENRKAGESKNPLGGVSRNYFNSDGKPTSQTDQLGRSSSKIHDNGGRVLREIMPEGDAVEYQYDVRSNKTVECRIAKGRVNWSSLTMLNEQVLQCNAGAGDLVTTTAYMEGPSVWTCVMPRTCNKPSYEIDARGNRTDYTWSGTHGQLLTETKPADANGVRPVTTYGYTAFTGVDGATFYLLTSKQEKIDATNTTTTTWAYNGAAAKFTLKEQVVDSGGLSLRTCFKFDAAGNLISKTEPKAGLASCP